MAKREENFLDQILDEFGEDVVLRKYEGGIPAISTGSLSLDVSIGIGGVPKGRFTEFYGPEGGGKTTLLLNIAKEAIKAGEKVLYIDTENSLDYAYAEEILGKLLKEDNPIFIQPQSAETSFEIAHAGINSGFSCILFDSVAALSPQEELDKGMEKMQVGLAPRITSKFLRKVAFEVRQKEVAFIYTNQVRANIGSYFGGYTTPAGYALKHYTSVRVYLSKSKDIEIDEKPIGNFVNFVIKKNKVGIPFRQATTNIIYGKGVDYYRDVISFASLLGVIKNRGSYFAFEEETIGNKPGVSNTAQALAKDQKLLDKIVEMCYNITGAKIEKEEKEVKTKDDKEEKEGKKG
jgi:recombination protein RecA